MFQIVEMSWFNRICAILFGKKFVGEDSGVRVYLSRWRGVVYVIHVAHLTKRAPDLAKRARPNDCEIDPETLPGRYADDPPSG